MFLFLTFTR